MSLLLCPRVKYRLNIIIIIIIIIIIHYKKRRATRAYYLSKPTRTRAHIHSKSFIPVSVARRESVSHASRTVCLSRGAECVVVRTCGCACVVVHVWF